MTASVAVIIPYFQRERGLLLRAVRSVLAQDFAGAVTVIVVDDESPISAQEEMSPLDPPADHKKVQVIRQSNAGPGAARNKGLDNLPDDTEFVAFLDSDDEWFPQHLSLAVGALELGNDFYYANIFDVGREADWFSEHALPNAALHAKVPGQSSLFSVQGSFFDEILDRCPIQTSTVVFRRGTMSHLRFRTDLRNAYEDVVLWLQAAKLNMRVVFSTQVVCRYGTGVNVFRGHKTWGSDQNLRVVVDSVYFRTVARREFALTPAQRRLLLGALPRLRADFVRATLARLRRGKTIPWRDLKRQIGSDLLSAVLYVPIAFRIAAERLFSRTPDS